MILPWNFSQPSDMRRHNQQVADGEYSPLLFWTGADTWAPRVLDIGACCGAFAWWVTRAFPAASVRCFEPNAAAFEHLHRNKICGLGQWVLRNAGVRANAGLYKMHRGANNLGEASMHELGEQKPDTHAVECVAAADLPDCDWLKVDTEGCEVEIVQEFLTAHESPRIISLEFHRTEDFGILYNYLVNENTYVLNRANIHRPDRGTCVFVREP